MEILILQAEYDIYVFLAIIWTVNVAIIYFPSICISNKQTHKNNIVMSVHLLANATRW